MEKNEENLQENTEKQVAVESVSVADVTKDAADNNAAPANESNETDDKIVGELQDKITDLTDKYMRAVAELENTRRRASRDAESAARTCGMSISKKFLPVMDALAEALKQSPEDAGIKSLSMALESAFAQIGIVKIESENQPLNPQFHNAISVIAADDAHAPNTIVQEMQAGYMYGDTVLRPAMVIVAK